MSQRFGVDSKPNVPKATKAPTKSNGVKKEKTKEKNDSAEPPQQNEQEDKKKEEDFSLSDSDNEK